MSETATATEDTIETRTDALAKRIAHALHKGDDDEWLRIMLECEPAPDIASVVKLTTVCHLIKEVTRLKASDEAKGQRIFDLELALGPKESETMKTVLLRIGNLENQTARAEFAGTWKAGTLYPRNCQVVHDGSTWTATIAKPTGTPGAPASGWILSAKGGR